MNADKILPILYRYLKDTDNRLLATHQATQPPKKSFKVANVNLSI